MRRAVQPYTVYVYSIDGARGALTPLSPRRASRELPYISLDKTGRYLFGASYGGTYQRQRGWQRRECGRRAAAGDSVCQRAFDPSTRPTSSSTSRRWEAIASSCSTSMRDRQAQLEHASCTDEGDDGPRHFITSGDNKYVYC